MLKLKQEATKKKKKRIIENFCKKQKKTKTAFRSVKENHAEI